MKILWLTHPESDYAASMLVDGFCAHAPNVERIDFYPHKWSYLGLTHQYTLPNIANGCTAPAPWMLPVSDALLDNDPAHAYLTRGQPGVVDHTWREVVTARLEANEYDLIVLESQRMHVVSALAELGVDHWVAKHRTPTLVLDGEDYTNIVTRTANLRVDVMLKREYTCDIGTDPLTVDGNTGTTWVAFPFCTTRRMVEECTLGADVPEHVFDASLLVGNTFPTRTDVARALRTADDLHASVRSNLTDVQTDALLPWNEYILEARRSRCAVVPRGWGYDTLRFWEMLPATLLCAQRLPIVHPFPFTEGRDILWWDTYDECLDKIRWLKAQEADVVARMRAAAFEHTRKYHTSTARVAWVLQILRDVRAMKGLRTMQEVV